MRLRFSSGSVTPARSSRNASASSANTSSHLEVVAEGALHLLGLALPQESVVHEDAGQPIADGAVDEHRGHGGVHAAREAADHASSSPTCSRIFRVASSTKALMRQSPDAPQIPKRKLLEDVGAPGRVRHLGVELHAEEPAVGFERIAA